MEQTIQFELVSPEAKLVSEPVKMAVIPGTEGEIGVLAGHSSLVASLKPGVVELHFDDGQSTRKVFIAGGFADVTPELCTVLAEQAVNVNDLDQAALEQKIVNLTEDLSLASEPMDKARIQRRIDLEKAKLAAVVG